MVPLEKSSSTTKLSKLTKSFFVLSIVLGIFFRFYNIDKKYSSVDEIFSMLRISCFTLDDVYDELSKQGSISSSKMRSFITPLSSQTTSDFMRGFRGVDKQMTPIYFIFLRQWALTFGTSDLSLRSLSVLFGLLTIVVMYFFALETFRSKESALAAASLVSISPFFVLYSQETRLYTLWSFVILLQNYLFQRCISREKRTDWLLYSLATIIAVYISPLSVFVSFSHFAYLYLFDRKKIKPIIFSGLLVATIYAPWIFCVHLNLSGTNLKGTINSVPIDFAAKTFLRRLSTLFVDSDPYGGVLKSNHPLIPSSFLQLAIAFMVLILVAYGVIISFRRNFNFSRTTYFVLTVAIFSDLPFSIPLEWLAQQYSQRYHLPFFLMILVLVANGLVKAFSSEVRLSKIIRYNYLIIFFLSVFSIYRSSQEYFWWNKHPSHSQDTHDVVSILNQSKESLLFWDMDEDVLEALIFSRYTEDKTSFAQFKSKAAIFKPFEGHVNLLFKPNSNLLAGLMKRTDLRIRQVVYENKYLPLYKIEAILN